MRKWDSAGVIPLVVMVFIGIALVIGLLIVAYLTINSIIVMALMGLGGFLLLKPQYLGGLPQTWRIVVPLVFIILGIVVYTGILEVG